jgi:ArsR family transcriptional regulator
VNDDQRKTEDDTCIPLPRSVLERKSAEGIAATFAALADPTRLAILNLIAESEREVCVCDITDNFKVGQPTVSHHVKILKDAGLITGEKRGKWVYYSPVRSRVEEVHALLEKVMGMSASKR